MFGFGSGNEVRVRITGDASGLNKELGEAKTKTQQFGQETTRMASTVKGALVAGAGLAIASFARDSIKSFTDLNESVNAVEVTFGDAADRILALGESASETMGISNAAFNSMAVQFSAFAETVAAEGGRDVVDVMKELTQRGADFASVMNLDVAEAMRVFQSGLAGETEPLRRYGIDVSAAATKTYAYAKGIAEAGSELSEQEKVLARYGLIMEQTEKTAGDFANTSGELANQSRILAANFEDLKAEIGRLMASSLGPLIRMGNDLITVFDGITDAIPGFEGGIFDLIRQLDPFAQTLEKAGEIVGWVADRFRETEETAIQLQGPIRDAETSFGNYNAVLETVNATQQRMVFEHIISGLKRIEDQSIFAEGGVLRLQGALAGLTGVRGFQRAMEAAQGQGPRGFTAAERNVLERNYADLPSQRHGGGRVPGLPGQERLVWAQGGETVMATQYQGAYGGMGQAGAGNVTNVYISGFLGMERRLREYQEQARRQ